MKLIVAVNKLGYIGKDNTLPWKCKEDLEHFKKMTYGQKLLVGRKTYEAMPKLKNRTMLVVGTGYLTLEEALKFKPDWVIGGASIYEQTAAMCDEIHISVIDDYTVGDTTLPITCLLHNIKTFSYYFKVNPVKFTVEDIKDKDRLEQMVENEAKAIYANPVSRRDRTLDEVKSAVRQGKVAELFLIENLGYKEAPLKYHDLVDQNGDLTEVKAYNGVYSTTAPFVVKDLKKIKSEGWNKSKWYILFRHEFGTYELVEKIKL